MERLKDRNEKQVTIDEIFLEKAKVKLEAAKLLLEYKLIEPAVSCCYYGLFNIMRSLTGEPTKKRWEHAGIREVFSLRAIESNIFSKQELKRIIEIADILYSLRVISDYKKNRIDSESIEEIGEYINFCFNLLNQIEEKR